MKKLVGLALFLLVVYALMLVADPGARSAQMHQYLGERIGSRGVISLGAGILIISGGIDLSIGATVCICALVMRNLLVDAQLNAALAIFLTLAMGALIGLVNGLIVTRLKVQAFVVTLSGLFIYRGAARWLSDDRTKGLGKDFTKFNMMFDNHDVFGLPMSLLIFLGLCALATVLLHMSVYGRYLFAVGSNEQAARFAGIAVDRYRTLAYVLCSTLAALTGVMYLAEQNSVTSSQTGSFFELYAIAGAVLGGCGLRGGEGSVLGVMIGTAIIVILPTFATMWGVPSSYEYIVVGAALLLGAILDETLRRRSLASSTT